MGRFELKGKTVVMTGASGGIGGEVAICCARRGAKLVLSGRNVEALNGLKDRVTNVGAEAVVFPADVTKPEDMNALVNKVIEATGRIDVMFLGAGYALMGEAINIGMDAWRKQMEVNFFGVLNGFYAALPHLIKQGSGQFIILSSLSGRVAMALSSPYCASKFALWGFVDSVRPELSRKGIDVLGVYPNFVKTPFQSNIESPDLNVPHDLAWKMRGQSPEHVAEKIVRASECRKGELVFTALGHIGIRLLPLSYNLAELSRKIAYPITKKMLKGK